MTNTSIATRYALALVESLISKGSDASAKLAGLGEFIRVLEGSRDLELVLLSPSVAPQRKRAVIGAICERLGLDRLIRNFLFVISDRRRFNLIREADRLASDILDEKLGVVRADISAAAPLSEEERRDIADQLAVLTGKRVRLNAAVEPDLIGGVVARVGSTTYDGSLRGQLHAMAERLAAD